LPFVFIFNPELLLIGIDKWWEGVMVIATSIIAILCFSSVTQGWFIVRVKWYEAIALLLVMIALFRPELVRDQFFPPFTPVKLEQFATGEAAARPGYSIRLHVTRETDYGDRLKLYRLATPEIAPDPEFGTYGLRVEPTGEGRLEVVELQRLGLAEQIGIEPGDFITAVEVEQVGLPSKRWVYPFALALLALVIAWQLLRRHWETAPAAAPSAGTAE
ncbi:MAG TPA: DUF3394 domain-containing protein, partial [Kiloniellales bacterium]|nr:DUF3394 domain-containing protein [Kiloniellales bacterium]